MFGVRFKLPTKLKIYLIGSICKHFILIWIFDCFSSSLIDMETGYPSTNIIAIASTICVIFIGMSVVLIARHRRRKKVVPYDP